MKISAALLMTVSVTLLCLCSCVSESSSQKEENDRVLKQAKENAENYISEKYGFDAEITGGEIIYDVSGYDFIIPKSEATTNAIINMSYAGRSFNVIISGKDENTHGSDNYQEKDIIAGFEKYVQQTLCEDSSVYIEPVSVWIGAKEDKSLYRSMDSRFDGSNFADVLGGISRICIECYDCDLSDMSGYGDIDSIMENSGAGYAEIVSYRSKEALEAHLVSNGVEYNFSTANAIEENAAAVAECRIYTEGEEKGYRNYSPDSGDVNYRECEGVKYYAPEITTLSELDHSGSMEALSYFHSTLVGDIYMTMETGQNNGRYHFYKTEGNLGEFTVAMPKDMYSFPPESAKLYYVTVWERHYGEGQTAPVYCDDKYMYATMNCTGSNDFCFFFAP